MARKIFSRFQIEDLPEYQRFKNANPQNPDLSSLQTIVMFGRAIHWLAIFDVIWPDFDNIDKYINIMVAYIVVNDPENEDLSHSFFVYIANMIAMFWELQLEQRYPHWDWEITIDDDPEVTLELEIKSKS